MGTQVRQQRPEPHHRVLGEAVGAEHERTETRTWLVGCSRSEMAKAENSDPIEQTGLDAGGILSCGRQKGHHPSSLSRTSKIFRYNNPLVSLMSKILFNILKERFGEGEAVVFARAATVGGQRCVGVLRCGDHKIDAFDM